MMPDRVNEQDLQVFKRLKPVYGEEIDKLWARYQSMKPERKQRLLRVLNAVAIQVLDMKVGYDKIYLEPPPPELIGGGDYHLGTVVYPSLRAYPFTIYKSEILRHLFVLGPSGTGKTTFFLGILQQLLLDGVPFWCVDWKRNYRCLLAHEQGKDVIVLTIGGDLAPLRLNMLQPPSGVGVNEWVESLADTISAGYLLMQGARNVLKEGMLDAIKRLGDQATLRDALPQIRASFAGAKSRKSGWLESTERAIDELTKGPFGDALNAREGAMTIHELLQRWVVFEAEGLGDDQRKTFGVFLLQAVLLARKKQTLPREELHHVILFDEAHNVFPKEKLGDPPNVQSRLAREVREFGEGLIAGTQQTDVSSSIIANSGTKIIFQTLFPWDAKFASDLLQVEQRVIGEIPKGHGIARLPDRYLKPFLFRFNEQPLKNTNVPDEQVRNRYESWRVPVPAFAPSETGSRELTLLMDIAAHPISMVTKRYERLHWNPNTGNTAQTNILDQGLAEFLWVDDGKTRLKLLSLTTKGGAIVQAHGGILRPTGPAGAEHELWRSRLRDRCEQHAYTVTEEYHLGERKRVDLLAQRGDTKLLIEVETGKSDVHENIRKCTGHGKLIVFFTNKTAFAAAQANIPKNVTVLIPESINQIHNILN